MSFPRFDPTRVLEFDLGRGQVAIQGASARVIVPADALEELCRHSEPEAVRNFGRLLGTEAGRRTADALGAGIRQASLEAVVEHLGGNLALMGFGSLGLERWGHALVFTVDDSPFGSAGDALLSAVLEGALQRAAGRDAHVVVLAREDSRVRLLVVSGGVAEQVRGWIGAGTAWGEVLSRLHGRGVA